MNKEQLKMEINGICRDYLDVEKIFYVNPPKKRANFYI